VEVNTSRSYHNINMISLLESLSTLITLPPFCTLKIIMQMSVPHVKNFDNFLLLTYLYLFVHLFVSLFHALYFSHITNDANC
jgi:hypothetical protein